MTSKFQGSSKLYPFSPRITGVCCHACGFFFFLNKGSGNWTLDLILIWQVLYWHTYLTGISYLDKMSIELLCHCELASVFTNSSVLIELEISVGMAFFLIHPTRPKYIEILVGCVIHIFLVTSLLCFAGQSKHRLHFPAQLGNKARALSYVTYVQGEFTNRHRLQSRRCCKRAHLPHPCPLLPLWKQDVCMCTVGDGWYILHSNCWCVWPLPVVLWPLLCSLWETTLFQAAMTAQLKSGI